MQVLPINSYSSSNINRNVEFKAKGNPSAAKVFVENSVEKGTTNKNILKNLFNKVKVPALVSAFMLLFATACDKEDLSQPQPTGYVPVEVPEYQNPYPTDDPKIIQEYLDWESENYPLCMRPDYWGPCPENYDEIKLNYQRAVVQWWADHGFDYNPCGV